MSYLDHIVRCNAHNPEQFLPFLVDGRKLGHVRKDNARHLQRFSQVFVVASDHVTLAPGLTGYTMRSTAVNEVLSRLADEGIIGNWRGEFYPVGERWIGAPAFEIERAGAPFLGTRAYGVHVNGFTRKENELFMWIGVRAQDRPVCPGQLDNMVAGGQPVGLGLLENVIKESAEEASVPEALACRAIPVGGISYAMDDDLGFRPDTMFCWDMELPPDFIPVNNDGEISEFRLMPARDVMKIVDEGFAFKFNCNLVNIDFFIRHGLLEPTHQDYEEILQGLRQ